MNLFAGTSPRIIGATVYATNRYHGLAPAQPRGEFETVIEVTDAYMGLIKTDAGNFYSVGNFEIQELAG